MSLRIFTGSPLHFPGTQDFFDRDSGLLSRGFQTLGVESNAITLLPTREGDLPAMVRASWQQLEDPRWWAALELDGLVFITWGNGKYLRMISAATEAGIRVAQMTDTQCLASPVPDFRAHLQAEDAHYWYEPRWKRTARTTLKLPITTTFRLWGRDRRDAQAIGTGHYFLAPTPVSAERFRTFTRRLQGEAAAEQVRFVPFPVNFHFKYDPDIAKENEVIAVGRWDSFQKRTPLLTATISEALRTRPTVRFRIFGQRHSDLDAWHAGLPEVLRAQVSIEGLVSNATLTEAYQRARVILVSAAYEGCHNASAEAICCGASVVGCRSPFLGVLDWHISRNSGRLAEHATPEALSRELLAELDSWENGERDPGAISAAWTRELHADNVAEKILQLFSEIPNLPLMNR